MIKQKGFCQNMKTICCGFNLEDQEVLIDRYFNKSRVHKSKSKLTSNNSLRAGSAAPVSIMIASFTGGEDANTKPKRDRIYSADEPLTQFIDNGPPNNVTDQ